MFRRKYEELRSPIVTDEQNKYDPYITEFGVFLAQVQSQTVKQLLVKDKPVYVISSPFVRCLETAAVVLGELANEFNVFGRKVHVSEEFKEAFNFLTKVKYKDY